MHVLLEHALQIVVLNQQYFCDPDSKAVKCYEKCFKLDPHCEEAALALVDSMTSQEKHVRHLHAVVVSACVIVYHYFAA